MSLQGWRALVCGASSGIGRATATALAAAGATVTLLARRVDKLHEAVAELKQAGASAQALVVDLQDLEALRHQVQRQLADHGPIQILINNSGGPPPGPLLDAAAADFEATFRRHVLAAQVLVQQLLPGMRQAGYGRIINIVSTSVREPIANLGVSNTIRAAVAGWAKSVSKELPPGVTINNVLPGSTATERLAALQQATAQRQGMSLADVERGWLAQIPEGRLARPEEIADVIAFLASPAAAYVRGVSLQVDGGRMASI